MILLYIYFYVCFSVQNEMLKPGKFPSYLFRLPSSLLIRTQNVQQEFIKRCNRYFIATSILK